VLNFHFWSAEDVLNPQRPFRDAAGTNKNLNLEYILAYPSFELLGSYLQRLDITQAKKVQIIGDGAPWIWNHMKPMLLALGVNEQRIIETLDVWHGSEYVHKLIDNMGSRRTDAEKRKLKNQFTDWLWSGQSDKIVEQCKAIFKRQNDTVRRCIAYLDKHLARTQYVDFKKLGLMCGSGIVESAIRRVINLRF
jgi:hypothetical protein